MKKIIKSLLLSLLVAPAMVLVSACQNAQKPYEYQEFEGKASYLATFNSRGGTPVESKHYDVITEMPISTRNGYVLKGWYIDNETSLVSFPYTMSKDTTFIASWSIATYSCSFETNGGSSIDPITDTQIIGEAPLTAREGYTFLGWHLKEDLSDNIVSFPLTLTSNITLYAEWEREEITPHGTLLAIAKVDAMESKSYWSFEYGENSLNIHAEVSDPFLYGYFDNPGYNDNVEVVLCPKNRSLSAGYVVNNTHHLLCDFNGNGYYNIAHTSYSMTANGDLPTSCSIEGRKASLEDDGFRGFVIDFHVDYSLFGLTREEALNNITMTVGMRNTNSYTATNWGAPLFNDYLSCWSYSLLKEDGTIANTEVEASTIIIGGDNYAIGNHHNINETLNSYNAFVYHKEGLIEDWEFEAQNVSLLSADKIILNIGRTDYYKGKISDDELVEAVVTFAKKYIPAFGAANIYVTSIEPLRDLSTNLSKLQTINTNIKNQCLTNGMKYIDTYSLFVSGTTLNKTYYSSNFVFSSTGYAAYFDLIKTYL